MDVRLLMTVFVTVFVAELGDKTQLSTMLYASETPNGKLTVFLGSALALVVSSALGVFAGALIGARLDPKWLARIAGAGFIAIGVWTMVRAGST
jgi:putative Ca2+/H+ antiporter (TMEM165/GDT1 family)